jgi:elongation factor G
MRSPRAVAILGSSGSGVEEVFTALSHNADDLEIRTENPWRCTTSLIDEQQFTLLACDDPESDTAHWPSFIFAMDTVIFVISAQHGMDSRLLNAWNLVIRHGIPRVIAVTHLDDGRADIDEVTAIARRIFEDDNSIHVMVQPAMDDHDQYAGTIDIINLTVTDASATTLHTQPCDPEHVAFIDSQRQEVIRFIAAHTDDSSFFDQVVSGVMPTSERIANAALECITLGLLTPVIPLAHQPYAFGVLEATRFLTRPQPPQPRLPIIVSVDPHHEYSAERDFCAEVVMQAGDLCALKVWSGSDDHGHEAQGCYLINQLLGLGAILPNGMYSVSVPEV